jgi:hypothetical protein
LFVYFYSKQGSGKDDQLLNSMQASTENEKQVQEALFNKNKQLVSDLLLHYVTSVDIKISSNLEQAILTDARARAEKKQ